MSDEQEEAVPEGPQIFMDPAQMAGVWANFAQVSHSEHEFTLDFVRLDFTGGRRVGAWSWRVSPYPPCSLLS
jgi:hypothetical protein